MGFCCWKVPPYGPRRHIVSSVSLVIATVAVYVSLQNYQPIDDLTLSPDADSASRAAKTMAISIMSLGSLAMLVNVIVLIITKNEDKTREIAEDARISKHESRSWFENFLDPQFLSTPIHIQEREKFFSSITNHSRTYRWGLLIPSLSLTIILVIRLFMGASVFLGDPATLDFGWKYGIDNEDDAAVIDDDAEKSISFTPEFNSFGHMIQGFFASLLATTVVMRGLIQLTGGRLRSIFHLAPYALTIYPTYNLIKRFVKAREAFAGSSFANNGFEWAAGFILGLALGQLITATYGLLYMAGFRKTFICSKEDTDEEDQTSETKEDNDEPADELLRPSCFIRFLQQIFCLFLLFTVYTSAVLYGLTWYSCLDGTQCVNANAADEEDAISVKVLCIMLVIPFVMKLSGFICF